MTKENLANMLVSELRSTGVSDRYIVGYLQNMLNFSLDYAGKDSAWWYDVKHHIDCVSKQKRVDK